MTLPAHRPLAALILLAFVGIASAQPYLWTSPASGNFSVAANWTPGLPPSAATTVLQFPNLDTQTTGGYTAANDLGPFDLNRLEFTAFGSPTADGGNALTVTASAANPLRFLTTTTTPLPTVVNTGTSLGVLASSSGTGFTIHNGAELTLATNNLGHVTVDAVLGQSGTGAGRVRIDSAGPTLFGSGPLVALTQANTYTGGTTLAGGTVAFANGAAFGTGPVTVSGPNVTIRPTADGMTVANDFVLNATPVLDAMILSPSSTSLTLSGNFSGPGGLTVRGFGATTYTFTGQALLTGPVRVESALGFAAGVVVSGNGRLSAASSYGGGFTANNAATNVNNRFNPAATFAGTFALVGNAAAASSESFATLIADGGANLRLSPTATQPVTLTFGALNRTNFGILSITAANLGGTGAGSSSVVFTTNPGGAIGGGGGPGTTTQSILPYALAFADPTQPPATTLVRYDASTGRVLPLNFATEYSANLYRAGTTTPTANVRRTGSATNGEQGGVAGLTMATTVNALVLDTNATVTPSVGLSVSGSGTVTVGSGALVVSLSDAATAPAVPSQINLGGLNFGTNPGYVHATSAVAINTPITGSGGLVKAGGGSLFLTATNTFTGPVTLNGGILAYFADAQLGNAANAVAFNSRIAFQVPALFSDANVTTLTLARPITVGAGTVTNNVSNGVFDISGSIGGTGGLTATGSGLVRLSGANTFQGTFTTFTGTTFTSDAALGGGSTAIISGGFLQPLASTTTTRDLFLDRFGTVVTGAGVTWQMDGRLTSQPNTSTAFVKAGSGTLALTASNPFYGATGGTAVRVGDIAPSPRLSSAATAETGGTLALAGPNGALPVAAGSATSDTFVVHAGAALHLDNSAAVNNNRIGSVPIGLIGGTLALTGNATADVNEFIGLSAIRGLTASGLAATVTLTQPTSGGAGRSTTLTTTGYAATGAAMTFIRGTNLGAAAGDRTAVVLNANPAQVNGLIPSVVTGDDATGAPKSFGTTIASGSQFALVPFTAYAGNVPTSGGSAASTYDAGSVTLTGAVAANAVRFAGGTIDLAGNDLSLTSGALLLGPAAGTIQGGTLNVGASPARITAVGNLSLGTAGSPTALVGTGGFNKFGSGILTLFGTAATTITGAAGNFAVSQGTLVLGNANAVGLATVNGAANVAPAVTVAPGATLDVSALTVFRTPGVDGYGTLALGGATVQTGNASPVLVGLSGTAASAFVVGVPQAEAAGNTFGGGTVTLAGNNTGFAGAVRVLDGTLVAATPNALGTSTTAIQLGDTSGTRQATLAIGANRTSFARAINVPAGSTPATPHTLRGQSAGNVTVSSNIALGQQLQLNLGGAVNGGTHFFTGVITGNGSLRQASGNASYTLQNSYSGGFIADAGANQVIGIGASSFGSSGPLGGGTVQFTARGGALRADGGVQAMTNNIVTTGTTTNFAVVGANDLFFQGTLDFSSLTSPFALNIVSRGVTTFGGGFGGTIASTSTQPLVKNGPGLVRFAAPAGNTYQGGTVVNAGTLAVQNPSGSGTGPGPVTVNDGAILTGPGSIGGVTTVNAGGIVRPAFDTISSSGFIFRPNGGLTMANGAIVATPVSNASSTTGRVQTSGQINLSAATTLNIYLEDNGVSPGTPVSFTLLQSTSQPIAFVGGAFSPANFAVTANFPLTAVSVTSPNSLTVVVNFTPVPEPAHVLAVAALAAGTVLRRRRP
ncbi:MAG: autotransporter-associated beta strand repeat-containing protein [Gemmataceae bacterium]